MAGERCEGVGKAEVEDEFACAQMLRGSLTSLHSSVERIFRVSFEIGVDDLPCNNNGQIWLKLRGLRNNVKAAKLFVKGLVNQEEQQEVSYPEVLHCIFCGAKGLFMDCLMRNTSALIVVGSPGFLLISGLAEPVVRASSLITDLVQQYEGLEVKQSDSGDRVSAESLDSRRAFKSLVEKWEDRHILDLLVLPALVKEILLDLVRKSGLSSSPSTVEMDGKLVVRLHDHPEDEWDRASAVTYKRPEGSSETHKTFDGLKGTSAAAKEPYFKSSPTSEGTTVITEHAAERTTSFPQEVGEEEQLGTEDREALEQREGEPKSSVGNKEFLLLMKFFTAMGYTEEVVKRVLARTGPREASQILDLVQQEQDRSDQEQKEPQDHVPQSQKNRPCETEHREDDETGGGLTLMSSEEELREKPRTLVGDTDGVTRSIRPLKVEGTGDVKEGGHEEDFVLRVMQKAAASCGYTEQKVAKVYSMLPDLSTHQLLLELQREGTKETVAPREGPREMDDVVLERGGQKYGTADEEAQRDKPAPNRTFLPVENQEVDDKRRLKVKTIPAPEPDLFHWNKSHTSKSQTQLQNIPPDVRGPPMSTYSSSMDQPFPNFQTSNQVAQTIYSSNPPAHFTTTPKQIPPKHDDVQKPKSKQAHHVLQMSILSKPNVSPSRTKEKRGFISSSSGVVVTGEQRFLEGLEMPFDLQITDKPGDPNLRTVIIDGSNVAMSHGLGHFFSCRGIALAVQHFWDRGHRHISVLLPQWRQKSDPQVSEQHYLNELQTLGLLSYTPSREVQGKRISCYDDRFMLQLAQKTNGVIVTNDNLRDLLDESHVWRDIIKKRLLQYTFVGDHFMVPDDPLGRGGPHLDIFLCSQDKPLEPGNHSFAGLAAPLASSKPPRSQTEVLNFRDRTLGGALHPAAGSSSKWRGRGQDAGFREMGVQQRQQGAAGPGLVFSTDRSSEETARLSEQLGQVFPDQDSMVTLVLQSNPKVTDINVLSDLILEQQLYYNSS
ncbi:NEDD4-binding protein 1 [Thalassophryne amazonica]|uniref:NEDD4-binding protein 1 n=1 Tax=Thalassophryne amazonica TaxID=390379 RepID=UPI001470B7C9|nr:NEDD4-binding protein 1 [Thalassophryne amazonica]